MSERTFRQNLNQGSPQSFDDARLQMAFGDVLRKHLKFDLRRKTAALDASCLATTPRIPLDPEAPASTILRAYARVGGSGTPGELTPAALYVTPTTGQIGISPNGSIVVLGTDLYSDIDVEYLPADGDLIVRTGLVVASNAVAVPADLLARGIVYLIDVNATVGTTTGRKIIQSPSGSAASTASSRLDVAKANVKFGSADAVTLADITFYVGKIGPAASRNGSGNVDLDALLQADSNLI